MDVYQTNTDGILVGMTIADQDPMDPTNWIIPKGCVQTLPPVTTDKEFARWDGNEWSVESIPDEEPEIPEELEDPANEARAERNGLLSNSDWTQLPDAPVNRDLWASYRTLLRGLPQQSEFPDNITWPMEPSS